MADNNQRSAYAILGLHKGASAEEIKEAYVTLVKKFDPERHTERFMVIQKAFDRLKEPETRAHEDVRTFNHVPGEFFFGKDEKSEVEEEQIDKALGAIDQKESAGDISPEEAAKKRIQGLMMRSWRRVQKRMWSDAIQDWKRILELDPTHRRAKNNLLYSQITLGYSYANHGLYDEAVEAWEEAAQMNPDSDEIIHNLALACERAGRHGEAERYWNETLNRWRAKLNREPDNRYLKMCVIELLREHGDSRAAAESDARRGTSEKDAPPSGEGKKRGPQSIEDYQEILKLNPDDFEARFRIASQYMNDHQWESAIEELEKLRKQFPRNIEVLNLLGWALLNHGKVDDAFMIWRKAKVIDPKNHQITESLIKAHMTMGRTLRERGLYTACLVHFKALTKYLPKSDEVQYEIGRTFQMKGDEPAAYQAFNKALEMNPKNREARRGISALKLRR